jgi:LmbE family N-acetylglucosaminyl deacetylase
VSDRRAPLPIALARPPRGRVLLLAPHADDDVIGPGGTAALHVEQGDLVHVIVVFNGLAGDPDERWSAEEYRLMRQREARAGGAHLGLSSYEFWDYPEGHEPGPAELVAAATRLAARVRELAPAIVYAPWIGEQHLDHHTLARVTRLALARAKFRGQAWGYEVWTPLVAELVIDVSAWYEKKVAALREHASQLAYLDVVHKGLALSAQRSIYLPDRRARHAEGFAPLGPPARADLALLG